MRETIHVGGFQRFCLFGERDSCRFLSLNSPEGVRGGFAGYSSWDNCIVVLCANMLPLTSILFVCCIFEFLIALAAFFLDNKGEHYRA